MNALRSFTFTPPVRLLAILAVATTMSCSSSSHPMFPLARHDGDGYLEIRTEKTHYTRSEIDVTGRGIRATIVNRSDRLFHATLGDAMNVAVEQGNLFAADGSDGFIERWSGSSAWRDLRRPPLIEGIREIEIRPHATYQLFAHVLNEDETGMVRLRIQYSDREEASPRQAPYEDFSNPIRVD